MKHQLQLQVVFNQMLSNGLIHIGLSTIDGSPMPEMAPGQFVEVAVDKAKVLLNRPFSIFNATPECLELLVKPLGRASDVMAEYIPGERMRVIAPLGHGFSVPEAPKHVLLVGGGVGVAPMLYQAACLNRKGIRPALVYGERTTPDPMLLKRLSAHADVCICTDDGSAGFHGLVTNHPVVKAGGFDLVQVCGPMPMMRAMHKVLTEMGAEAEFSLENKMACGLGACLCCVEKTTTGNRCVCSDGPVFNAKELPW